MCISVDVAFGLEWVSVICLLEMAPRKWTSQRSQRHWEKRQSAVILRPTNVRQLNQTRVARQSEHRRKRARRKDEFISAFRVGNRPCSGTQSLTGTGEDLRFWVEHASWSYCRCCGLLQGKKLLPSFTKRSVPSSSKVCPCKSARYKVPHPARVPAVLKKLAIDEIHTLRPFCAFSGK